MTQLSVDLGVGDFFGDLGGFLSDDSLFQILDVLSLVLLLSVGRFELISTGIIDVSLLVLAVSSGEEDQLALVVLETLYIGLKGLL